MIFRAPLSSRLVPLVRMPLCTLLPVTAAVTTALAEPQPSAKPAETSTNTAKNPTDAKPKIQKLDDGRMRIGKVTLDPKTRHITFPAWVNQTEDWLEFLLVHEHGKTHESLLASKISATNLNVAFKLLRYRASRELYIKVNPDHSYSDEFESATAEEKRESRVRIQIKWTADKQEKIVDAHDWINHATTEQPMVPTPWVYGGSQTHDGTFAAKSTGNLVAIFQNNASLLSYPGKDMLDDTVWLPHPTRVPPVKTPVTVIISPYSP